MFVAWLGWLFLQLFLSVSTKTILIAVLVTVVIGLIALDLRGAIGVLLLPMFYGLIGCLAKFLLTSGTLLAIFGLAMYIAMDGTWVYMIVYAIRHRKKAK